jgi:hypothetical protein
MHDECVADLRADLAGEFVGEDDGVALEVEFALLEMLGELLQQALSGSSTMPMTLTPCRLPSFSTTTTPSATGTAETTSGRAARVLRSSRQLAGLAAGVGFVRMRTAAPWHAARSR